MPKSKIFPRAEANKCDECEYYSAGICGLYDDAIIVDASVKNCEGDIYD